MKVVKLLEMTERGRILSCREWAFIAARSSLGIPSGKIKGPRDVLVRLETTAPHPRAAPRSLTILLT